MHMPGFNQSGATFGSVTIVGSNKRGHEDHLQQVPPDSQVIKTVDSSLTYRERLIAVSGTKITAHGCVIEGSDLVVSGSNNILDITGNCKVSGSNNYAKSKGSVTIHGSNNNVICEKVVIHGSSGNIFSREVTSVHGSNHNVHSISVGEVHGSNHDIYVPGINASAIKLHGLAASMTKIKKTTHEDIRVRECEAIESFLKKKLDLLKYIASTGGGSSEKKSASHHGGNIINGVFIPGVARNVSMRGGKITFIDESGNMIVMDQGGTSFGDPVSVSSSDTSSSSSEEEPEMKRAKRLSKKEFKRSRKEQKQSLKKQKKEFKKSHKKGKALLVNKPVEANPTVSAVEKLEKEEVPKHPKLPENWKQEPIKLKDGEEGCTICFEYKCEAAVQDCGHLCMCMSCARKIAGPDGAKCPICKQEIKYIQGLRLAS